MRGGSRPNAGRKKGSIAKKTRTVAIKARDAGLTPIEYMLQVMRDTKEERSVRLEAAKSAAPYVHPRLASVSHTGKDGGPIAISTDLSKLSDDQLAAIEPVLSALAATGTPPGASTH